MCNVLTILLTHVYNWLACAESPQDADLIFALAGREARKRHALEMFSQGCAPHLLVSVGRFEISRFEALQVPVRLNLVARAAVVEPRKRHFFVHLTGSIHEVLLVSTGRFGTLSEILALRRWLEGHTSIRSISIISSATHLRRVRLCCRRLLPLNVVVRLVQADEGEVDFTQDAWWRSRKTRSMVLSEFPKLLVYWVALRLPFPFRTQQLTESFL